MSTPMNSAINKYVRCLRCGMQGAGKCDCWEPVKFTRSQMRRIIGDFPEAGGFAWDRVDHFEATDGIIQGISAGEPVGPAFIVAIIPEEFRDRLK